MRAPTELILIRHAPALTDGRLCGRTDVPAALEDDAAFARLSVTLDTPPVLKASPALRCRQTVQKLFPDQPAELDPRLWEQDFGDEDGVPWRDLPDLGLMSRQQLAARRPAGGESFADMVARVTPALQEYITLSGPVVIVAHAGTVRAALSLALGDAALALAFEVAPLSMTRVTCYGGEFGVSCVNQQV